MTDHIFELLTIPYGAVMAALVSAIVAGVKNSHKSRKEHKESFEKIEQNMQYMANGIAELKTQLEYSDAMTSRYRIIRFDDEEGAGLQHSEDHWDQIVEDVNTYQAFCASHPNFINHKGQAARDRILKKYDSGDYKCLKS